MADPLVSVVIPAYRAEAYIEATIDSVRRQTLADWELIVIDDGSPDRTADLVRRAMADDPRIRLISVENGGVSRARNRGVAESRAPLVAFLDADDRWAPEALACHHGHFAADPDLGVSFARVELLTPEGERTGKLCQTLLTPLEASQLLALNLTITTSNWVVRRRLFEQLGGFVEGMNHSEDMEWLLRVRCRSAWKVQAVDRVLTYYRTAGGGLSAQLRSMEEGWLEMLERVRAYAPPGLVERHGGYALASILNYLAQRSIRLGLPIAVARRYLVRALRADWRVLLRQPRPTLSNIVVVVWRSVFDRLRPPQRRLA